LVDWCVNTQRLEGSRF